MADSPSSFGSGRPTISRVPEGGGGAFRPRSVRGAAKAQATAASSTVKSAPNTLVEAVSDHAPQDSALDDSALWERLAAVNARRQALKERSAQWSREGVGGNG
jgi:hypothetical protein